MRMPQHIETIAKRKAGNIPGWEAFAFEKVGPDAIVIEGGVPTLPLIPGLRKRWLGPTQKVVVTEAETAEEYRRFEAETGKCGECLGEGKVYAGWNHKTGVRFNPCPKCSAPCQAVSERSI